MDIVIQTLNSMYGFYWAGYNAGIDSFKENQTGLVNYMESYLITKGII